MALEHKQSENPEVSNMEGVIDKSSSEPALPGCAKQFVNWREVLVVLHDVLHWEQDWHPIILSSIIALFYYIIWWHELSLLSTMSTLALSMVIVDLITVHFRALFESLCPWDEKREAQFNHISSRILNIMEAISGLQGMMLKYRKDNPPLYYTTVLSALLILSWLGTTVPNLFLCFVFTTLATLYPGLKKRGYIGRMSRLIWHHTHALISKIFKRKSE